MTSSEILQLNHGIVPCEYWPMACRRRGKAMECLSPAAAAMVQYSFGSRFGSAFDFVPIFVAEA